MKKSFVIGHDFGHTAREGGALYFMQARTDLHIHTNYSHGKGTIEKNVCMASKCGLQAVGIADHSPSHFFIGIGGVKAVLRELDSFIKEDLPAGINFLISSDAHIPERVGDFLQAYHLIRRLNIPRERIVNLAENWYRKEGKEGFEPKLCGRKAKRIICRIVG